MAALLSKSLKLHRLLLPCPRQSQLYPPLFSFSTSLPSPPPPPTATAAAASQSQESGRGIFSKFLLFLPGAITFGLGTWQLFRRQEKIEMLDYRKKRLEMEPIRWNELSSLGHDLGSLEFRKVVCEGDFDESKSIYVGPRSRSISGVTENGYYVITPLIPRGSDSESVQLPILVNRGWVPRDWRNKNIKETEKLEKDLQSKAADTGANGRSAWWKFWSRKSTISEAEEHMVAPVGVIGVIRGSEKPSIFVPANDPNSGQWFYVDIPMIARTSGLPDNAIYIEDINADANATNPYPVPKDVNSLIRYSVMPQDHLNYTITWYSLSAAVTFMAVKRIKAKNIRL
ncbi:surfeit locus protein 1-like [Typha angustifolia]|uniref:surfeit locus protein 1-like n=1 Tax=Typha angustifolia TaxID=59011 RepID=UPI003C2D3832